MANAYLSKSALVTILKERETGKTEEELKGLGRDELLALHKQYNNEVVNTEEATELLNNNEPGGFVVEVSEAPKVTEMVARPPVTSHQWTDYVLSQFDASELINGKPMCDGLRRVFELLMGDIHNVDMEVIKAPQNDYDTSATVKCTIKYGNIMFPKSISDVFSISKENTPPPWHLPSVAVAATKAEARALRKGLRLQKILSSEEVEQGFGVEGPSTSGMSDEVKPANDVQRRVINEATTTMNIDIPKLLKHLGITNNWDTLKTSDAHKVLATINEYKRGTANKGLDIPKEIINTLEGELVV